jgi:hypothetical protein
MCTYLLPLVLSGPLDRRIARSHVNDDKWQRKDVISINKDILALGNVISALANGKAFVPYRGSKLTRLLRESLGKDRQQRALLIACISPAIRDMDETLGCLRLVGRAKTSSHHHDADGPVAAPRRKKPLRSSGEELEHPPETVKVLADDLSQAMDGDFFPPATRFRRALPSSVASGEFTTTIATTASLVTPCPTDATVQDFSEETESSASGGRRLFQSNVVSPESLPELPSLSIRQGEETPPSNSDEKAFCQLQEATNDDELLENLSDHLGHFFQRLGLCLTFFATNLWEDYGACTLQVSLLPLRRPVWWSLSPPHKLE